MKRVLWACIISLFLGACAVKQEGETNEDRIYDWMSREEKPAQYNSDGLINFNVANFIAVEAFETIEYDFEKPFKHFQTRVETLTRKKAVCIDYAILIYLNLRDVGFPDGKIGCLIYDNPNPKERGHAIAVIFLNEDKTDYYPLGAVPRDYTLALGFDLFDVWHY